MDEFLKVLANLLKVKSLVTIVLIQCDRYGSHLLLRCAECQEGR